MRTIVMIRRAVLMCLSCAALYMPVWGQQTKYPTLVVCGRKFTLLSTRESVLAILADSSECKAVKLESAETDPSTYFLTDPKHPELVRGQLYFWLGHLTSISKSWETEVHNEVDYARIVIGLIHEAEQEEQKPCEIKTEYRTSPDLDGKAATITCGKKKIDLRLDEYKGNRSISITETVGY